MIVKIGGKEVKLDEITLCEGGNGKIFDCSKVPTPDLSNVPNPEEYANKINYILAKIDHINYSVMSKTEVTDFLYRLSNDWVRFGYENIDNLTSIMKAMTF